MFHAVLADYIQVPQQAFLSGIAHSTNVQVSAYRNEYKHGHLAKVQTGNFGTEVADHIVDSKVRFRVTVHYIADILFQSFLASFLSILLLIVNPCQHDWLSSHAIVTFLARKGTLTEQVSTITLLPMVCSLDTCTCQFGDWHEHRSLERRNFVTAGDNGDIGGMVVFMVTMTVAPMTAMIIMGGGVDVSVGHDRA